MQGTVDPDGFHVFKPTLRAGHRQLLRRKRGAKEIRMVCAEGPRGGRAHRQRAGTGSRAVVGCAEGSEGRVYAGALPFDGFSIGSNDLTQLDLGVDRDPDLVAFDFDGRDPGRAMRGTGLRRRTSACRCCCGGTPSLPR